jgi:hypothetical protein
MISSPNKSNRGCSGIADTQWQDHAGWRLIWVVMDLGVDVGCGVFGSGVVCVRVFVGSAA